MQNRELEKTGLKILIVDDEPGWRDLLSLELTSPECNVVTASSAAEALEFLGQGVFDLVITDVRMPGDLDGIDMIRNYRSKKPEQKAIFMTGYAIEEKIEQILSEGQALILRKPFESEALLGAIQSLVTASF